MSEASHNSTKSRRHGFPYLLPGQAQKHVTHNVAVEQIDTITHLCLTGLNINTPPENPVLGACYDIGSSPEGLFTDYTAHIAAYLNSGWHFFPKVKGMSAFYIENNTMIVYDGNSWEAISGPVQLDELTMVAINTQADPNNKLSVKSENILFAAEDLTVNPSGDVRVSLSKNTPQDTASLIYGTDFKARAETGLLGSDNYQIKVSSDGSHFRPALEIDNSNGNLGLGKTPTQALDILKSEPGITRISVANHAKSAGAGASLDILAADNNSMRLIQYNTDTAYMVSNASSMYYQLTGSNPLHRFYLGTQEILQMSVQRISMKAATRLLNVSISTLPSPSSSGSGALIYVTDEGSGGAVVYSDGKNWKRTTDGNIIS